MHTDGINYYQRLHVSPIADLVVIKAAYRALMKKYHPDHRDGSTGTAEGLNEAYETLSHPTNRVRYDEGRKKLLGRRIGSFVITDVIAEGGFGVTYKGKHHLTGKPVCVKQSHETSPELNAILVHETNAIWDLRHHGLPVMRDLLEMEDESLLLVMSFVEGMNLAQLTEKVGRLEPKHVSWITERCLNVLMFLHRFKVVHGDIKPQNVMLQPVDHTVTLVDFGLAMVNPSRHSKPLGYTEIFAPPEQLAGRPLLPESDLYSLGVVMLFLLSGGDLEKVISRSVPNDLPRPFRHFISELLRIDPLERPDWRTAFDQFQRVREDSGLPHTKNEPIPGL